MGAKKGAGGEITNYGGASKKGFLTVTLVTILAILSVIAVYAVLIGSFTGQEVTVGGASATVTYSLDNTNPWTQTLTVTSPSDPWYSRLEVGGGYNGPVTITWQLQQKTGTSTWADVSSATVSTLVLTGSSEYVYATTDGTGPTSNRNWGTDTTAGGTYHIVVTVNSA